MPISTSFTMTLPTWLVDEADTLPAVLERLRELSRRIHVSSFPGRLLPPPTPPKPWILELLGVWRAAPLFCL